MHAGLGHAHIIGHVVRRVLYSLLLLLGSTREEEFVVLHLPARRRHIVSLEVLVFAVLYRVNYDEGVLPLVQEVSEAERLVWEILFGLLSLCTRRLVLPH